MVNVQLAVYDLSRGMARQLSRQFLGIEIEMIPHTGVIVFGQEYFFGGGIQRSSHASFIASHGMPPVQLLNLGETQVSQVAFEAFLNDIRPRYTAATYDLLSHNCNNFSDEVVQFLCGARVPEAITGLPQRVLSTPMGAALRPMLEQAQAQLGANGNGIGGAPVASPIPGFGNGGGASTGFPLPPWPPSASVPAAAPATRSNPWAAPPPTTGSNPWATPAAPPAATANANPWATPAPGAAAANANPWAASAPPTGATSAAAAADNGDAAAAAAAAREARSAAVKAALAADAKAAEEAAERQRQDALPLLSTHAAPGNAAQLVKYLRNTLAPPAPAATAAAPAGASAAAATAAAAAATSGSATTASATSTALPGSPKSPLPSLAAPASSPTAGSSPAVSPGGNAASPSSSSSPRSPQKNGWVLTSSEGDTLLRLAPALQGKGTVPSQTFAVLLKVLRAAAAPSANTAAVASGSGNGGGGGNGDSSNGEKGNGPRADSRAEFTALCLLRLVVLQPSAWAYMLNDGKSRTACLDAALAPLSSISMSGGGAGGSFAGGSTTMRVAIAANLFALPSGVTLALEPPRARFLLSVATRHLALPPSTTAASSSPAQLSSNAPPGAATSTDGGSGGGGEASESVRSLTAALVVNLVLSLPPMGPSASSSSGLNTPELYSSVLSAAFRDLAKETDSVVAARRARAGTTALRRSGARMATLAKSLCLDKDISEALAVTFPGDDNAVKTILREANKMLL